jgi:alpha-galactosidase
MTYAPSDGQPSVFLLKEDSRQSILTLFNWTEGELKRDISLASLGLKSSGKYRITEVFGAQNCCNNSSDSINLVQPAHSVRMFKLIDNSIPATPPPFEVHAAASASAGDSVTFKAVSSTPEEPMLTSHWDFGDGSAADGVEVSHTYTHEGEFEVHVTAMGVEAITNSKTLKVSISGTIPTRFVPADRKRPE